jgi:peptidyl-prolyl cis-trans isomerase B (cyclophilin B)
MTTPTATITTKFGAIHLELFSDIAPGHVNNFLDLARKGFYDGTTFHRVIPGFMIQGGCPNTKPGAKGGPPGTGGPGYHVKAEFNATSHTRGILSAARASDPDSAGCQFFIVVKDSTFLDRQYTAFGRVTAGMEIADMIVNVPRGANDLPRERVEMTVTVNE